MEEFGVDIEGVAKHLIPDFENLNEGVLINHLRSYCEEYDGEFISTKEKMEMFLEDISSMNMGFVLAKLCSEDQVQCYWDDKENEMKFWGHEDMNVSD